MVKKLLHISLILFMAVQADAQIEGMSQSYVLNKLGYNIAYAGSQKKLRLQALGQYGPTKQLGGLSNYYISVDAPLGQGFNAAVQFSKYSYKVNAINSYTIGINKKIKINEQASLAVGINGGISNNEYDYDTDYGLSYVSAMTAKAGSFMPSSYNKVEFSQAQRILGAGVFFNFNKWHFGAAIPNIIENKLPDYQNAGEVIYLQRPAFINVENDFKLSEKYSLRPGLLYRVTSNELSNGIDASLALRYKEKYSFGLWQQRIGAASGPSPLLATTELTLGGSQLAYSINLSGSKNNNLIQQQILLRLDIDFLKAKE